MAFNIDYRDGLASSGNLKPPPAPRPSASILYIHTLEVLLIAWAGLMLSVLGKDTGSGQPDGFAGWVGQVRVAGRQFSRPGAGLRDKTGTVVQKT